MIISNKSKENTLVLHIEFKKHHPIIGGAAGTHMLSENLEAGWSTRQSKEGMWEKGSLCVSPWPSRNGRVNQQHDGPLGWEDLSSKDCESDWGRRLGRSGHIGGRYRGYHCPQGSVPDVDRISNKGCLHLKSLNN